MNVAAVKIPGKRLWFRAPERVAGNQKTASPSEYRITFLFPPDLDLSGMKTHFSFSKYAIENIACMSSNAFVKLMMRDEIRPRKRKRGGRWPGCL